MRSAITGGDVWPPVPVAGHFDLQGAGRDGWSGVSTVRRAVVAVARRWCVDRALRPRTLLTVASLMDEAVRYGCRYGAQGLDLSIRWLDVDRMRLELTWHGCPATRMATDMAPDRVEDSGVHLPARVFNRLADGWGVEVAGVDESWQWLDVDTRGPTGSRPAAASA